MTVPSTAHAIATLALNGTPIVCVDTCSILDVQRGLVREDVNVPGRIQALKLVEDVEAGRLISVVTRQIELEFHQNRPLAVEGAAKELRHLVHTVAKAEDVAGVFEALTVRANLDHLRNHAVHALGVVDRWWAASYCIDERPDLHVRAMERVNLAQAPAKQGKQNVKDCLITETFLDLIQVIRDGGSTGKVVFLSANTEDYAVGKNDQSLNAGLVREFGDLGIVYATNPGQARKELGLQVR